jgi:hypothetical protein
MSVSRLCSVILSLVLTVVVVHVHLLVALCVHLFTPTAAQAPPSHIHPVLLGPLLLVPLHPTLLLGPFLLVPLHPTFVVILQNDTNHLKTE